MKKKLRWLLGGLGIVLVIIGALVVMLPWLVSTPTVRNAFINRLQAMTGARITIDDGSLSWRHPQRLVNLRYEDQDAGVTFRLNELTVSRGLLSIARHRDAGDIVLDHPHLSVRLPAPDPVRPDPVPREVPDKPPAEAPRPRRDTETETVEKPEPFEIPRFAARLIGNHGTLVIEDGDSRMTIGDLNFVMDWPAGPAERTFHVSGRQVPGPGTFAVGIGIGPAMMAAQHGFSLPPGDVTVRLSQWDMAPLGDLVTTVAGRTSGYQTMDLRTLGLSGALTLDATYQLRDSAGGVISMDMRLSDFLMTDDGRELLADEDMRLAVHTGLNLTDEEMRVDDGQFTFTALGTNGRLAFRDFILKSGQPLPSGNLLVDIDCNLTRLAPMLAVAGDMLIAGQARLQGELIMRPDALVWRDVHLDIGDFALARDTLRYATPTLKVRTYGQATLAERIIDIEHYLVEGLPGRVQGDVQISDWEALPMALAVRLDAVLPIGAIIDALSGSEGLEAWHDSDGVLNVHARVASAAHEAWQITVDSEITELRVPMDGENVFTEDLIKLTALAVMEADGHIAFDPLTLETAALGISASGEQRMLDDRLHLRCHGMLRYDLDALAQRASSLQVELPLSIRGRAERPFQLDMPLSESWLSQGMLDIALFVEQIEAYGLQTGPIDMPLTLRDGVARAAVETRINEGYLALHPRLETVDGRMILTLAAHPYVLRDVWLTDTMADEIISRIHPIFKGAVITDGAVDLVLDSLHLPIEPDALNDIRFQGVLRLKEVTLATSGLLDQVRETIRVRESAYVLKSQELRFRCENGRVTTDPLELTLGGHPIHISGSMGLDETINYTVSTPITERLVGREVYQVLSGQSLAIPVGGTTARPRVDENAVRAMVAELIRQAGRKTIERGAEQLLRRLLE